MNAPIERVDNEANAQPGEIIKRVERSEKEKNQQGFSRALEEQLKEELEKEKNKPSDEVLISGEKEKEKENENKQPQDEHQRRPSPDRKSTDDSGEEVEPDLSDGHLDIKA
jgi:hypothetical protein